DYWAMGEEVPEGGGKRVPRQRAPYAGARGNPQAQARAEAGHYGTRDTKKNHWVLRGTTQMKYQAIDSQIESFSVTVMCNLFGVSKSGYYAWKARDTSHRDTEEMRLVCLIEKIHQ